MKTRRYTAESIKRILGTVSLESRLKCFLELEYIMMNINNKHNGDINIKADVWAKKVTKRILQEYKQWEKDGKPK